jgi:hypothetical protein
VGDARALPEPSLGYRWVKANVYSALFNVVTGFTVVALANVLAVRNSGTGAVTISMFVVFSGLITALGLGVFARLTGGVLNRKLPSFPMRNWIALHVVVGCVFGMALAPAATVPEEVDPEPLEIETIALITIASVVVGALLGALFGSLQALVLRKVAGGLFDWIGFSALAGTTLGLFALAAALGPQSGLGLDIAGEAASFIVMVAIGIILLPAVRRLRPREAPNPAPDAPPPT